jgi:hypothetical protein
MNDSHVDESWKQDRVNNRRRLSAIPMGASRIVAVQDSEEAGSATAQMVHRRQSRRSLSNSQAFMPPNQSSLAEKGLAGSATPRPSSQAVFGSTSPADKSLESMKEEDEDGGDDWESVNKKKKEALAELETNESKDDDELLNKAEDTSSPKGNMSKAVEEEEEVPEQGIMQRFSVTLPTSIELPKFSLPTMAMPWDTPDVKDTTNHTAI